MIGIKRVINFREDIKEERIFHREIIIIEKEETIMKEERVDMKIEEETIMREI